MSFNLRNRSLLTVQDYTQREFRYLLDLARDLKRAKYARTEQKHLESKEICLIFEKTSTRTRCALLILDLLTQGSALAVLPQHLSRRLATAGQVRMLDVDTPGLVMPVSVFSPAGAPASTAVETFKQCLIAAAALR